MTEPLTKEEQELARSYAETVYADTTDSQKHTAAVMILRLLDSIAALEAELARLRPLAGAVGNLPPGFFIGNGLYGDKEWVVICENEENGHLFPRINARDAAEALHLANELAALRAAKAKEPCRQ